MDKIMRKVQEFTVIIEKDENGVYVGEVVELPGCYSQGKTIEELLERIKEAIEGYLEVSKDVKGNRFVGVRKIPVKVRT